MKNTNENSESTRDTKQPYFVRERYFSDLEAVHIRAFQYLKKINADWETLNIGKITMDDLIQIEKRDFTSIQERYKNSIEVELKNIKNPLLRQNMSEGTPEFFIEWRFKTLDNIAGFANAAHYPPSHYRELSVKNFTIENGEVKFTKQNSDYLKSQFCSIYLTNPKQERFVSLLEETFKGLTDLKATLVKNNAGILFSVPGENGLFDEGREDVIVSNHEIIAYIEK